ncbi:MAG: isoprenylcysteine carboxylmethyltransferase family protein [Thermodesulfovibrionia bacterium]|nr:isoprenylcysteine carboxylmethyltransferase family protein [Thermodesulfovibrionia bacterium]MCK5286643.1 isoprenylcysteine carboxylmethyltransferase family protein [Thermodesulfovibrionia bacterium]MCK5511893.1 isoprenylcysteine carboxylmethyltransferase family protein [Thermodesulfovibrionia bacterium]
MEYVLLCTLWIFWCFIHSFLISTKTTVWFKSRLGDTCAYYRIFYNLFSLVTVLPLLYWQWTIPGSVVIRLSPLLLVFKYAALIFSVIVVAGSFFTFDVLEFAGIRHIMDRHQETQKPPVISKHGFYSIVRHPMYLGGFVFLLASMTYAPLAQFLGYLILAVYMIIGTLLEDKRLARELGDVYREYQKEVPMFFPKILRKRD